MVKDGGREDVSVVAGDPELSFAALLRQLRTEARLTQEELAETAGISARAVSDLERGVNRTAHKDTAQLLAAAFGLSGPAEERFVAAARGRAPVGMVVGGGPGAEQGNSATAAATRVLPRDIASFTGRHDELARLLQSIHSLTPSGGVVGICAIDGMAGIGKTTLAVHAAHYLAERFPGWAVLPATACLHPRTAAGGPIGRAGQPAADRRAHAAANPGRPGGPGGPLAEPGGRQEDPAAPRRRRQPRAGAAAAARHRRQPCAYHQPSQAGGPA